MNLQLILLIAGVVALISFGLWWIVRAPARSGRGAGTGDRRLAQQADAPLELLRVEFDPASGDREDALRVWITGRRIARVDDIADDDLREPLRRLLQWLVPAPLAPGTSKTADVGAGARPAPLAPAPPPAPDLPAERADEFNAPFFARLRDSLTPQPYTAPQTPPAQGTPRPKK
ncbi:MAG: hypothetical protein HY259_08855, partial [Chloroflexi bacterium]|nr:hypothetical protein [Chloroflexota bacterium]